MATYSSGFQMSSLAALSSCAKDYISALTNPFNPSLSGPPCIPDYRSIPSSKFYLRGRGEFRPPAAEDAAWIIFNPRRPIGSVQGSGAAQAGPIFHSVAGSRNAAQPAGDEGHLVFGDTDVTDIKFFDTDLDADVWDVTGALATSGHNRFRVVAAGLKVNYAGQADERQGTVTFGRIPDNSRVWWSGKSKIQDTADTEVAHFPTVDDLRKFDDVHFGPLQPSTHTYEVHYRPVDNDDFEYRGIDEGLDSLARPQSGAATNEASQATGDVGFMFFACTNMGAEQVPTFTYEVIAWYEAIGPTMRGNTPSHTDLGGLGYAMSLKDPKV